VTATAYLVPWFNGGCPWTTEYMSAINQSIPLVCFWAFDHFCLFSWPLPLKEVGRVTFLRSVVRMRVDLSRSQGSR